MSKSDSVEAEEVTLRDVTDGKVGYRARLTQIARNGLPHLNAEGTDGTDNVQALTRRRRDLVQYRACTALGWSREQILEETGWSLQRLQALEQITKDEDRRIWNQVDPVNIYADYREQQLLCAHELEDLAVVFRNGKQFSALVSAIKARSEVFDKIIKIGQELGLIKRAAREVNLRGSVDVRSLSIAELRVHLSKEVSGLRRMLEPPKSVGGVAGVVLQRVLTQKSGGNIADEAPQAAQEPAEPVKGTAGPRVKRLASSEP